MEIEACLARRGGRVNGEPRARTRSGAQLAPYDCLLTKFGVFRLHMMEPRIFPFSHGLRLVMTILQVVFALTNSLIPNLSESCVYIRLCNLSGSHIVHLATSLRFFVKSLTTTILIDKIYYQNILGVRLH